MKYFIGFIMGLILASSMSIAQEWMDSSAPQIIIPMPSVISPIYPYPIMPYSLPPMPQPQWEHISPC